MGRSDHREKQRPRGGSLLQTMAPIPCLSLRVASAGWLDGLDRLCVRCPAQPGTQLVPSKGACQHPWSSGGTEGDERFQGDKGSFAWNGPKGMMFSASM